MSKTILVPIDFSDVTDAVLAAVRRFAGVYDDARIFLVHIVQAEPDFVGYEVGPQYIRDSAAQELRREHQQLQKLQRSLTDAGLAVTALLVPGHAEDKIIDQIDRIGPDLIVLGSHGHGAMYNLLVGGVCQAVLRHAACPVVVVPCRPTGRT